MDARSAMLVRKVMLSHRRRTQELRYHFYGVLVTHIWASFEAYFLVLFRELYEMRPNLLKSSEQISYEEAVDHVDDIKALLIERQLERIGHMALAELLKYLDIRLKYKPSAATRARLVEYYWLRNTMAHATGYVGVTGQPSIPAGVRVHGNQVRVGKKYFLQMVAQIRRTVESVERLVEKRFFRATSQ